MYRFIAAASLIGSFIVPTLRGSNLADRRIPAEPDRSIKLPVSPEKAIAVIQDTLLAAGVASGVEQAAPGSDSSLVGVPPTDGKLTLSGRRVRDAFDDFVSFDRTPTPTADGATIEFVTRDVIYSAFPQSR
jgi:hypothetical protein